MLDLKEIRKQIARLSGLNFPPIMAEGWSELAAVLQRRCLTMDHVSRIIDRWLESEENVPKPSQLAFLASTVPADPSVDRPTLAEPCEQCAPDGLWRLTDAGICRCSCARGCQLAALDEKRKAAEAIRPRKQPARLNRINRDDLKEIG